MGNFIKKFKKEYSKKFENFGFNFNEFSFISHDMAHSQMDVYSFCNETKDIEIIIEDVYFKKNINKESTSYNIGVRFDNKYSEIERKSITKNIFQGIFDVSFTLYNDILNSIEKAYFDSSFLKEDNIFTPVDLFDDLIVVGSDVTVIDTNKKIITKLSAFRKPFKNKLRLKKLSYKHFLHFQEDKTGKSIKIIPSIQFEFYSFPRKYYSVYFDANNNINPIKVIDGKGAFYSVMPDSVQNFFKDLITSDIKEFFSYSDQVYNFSLMSDNDIQSVLDLKDMVDI